MKPLLPVILSYNHPQHTSECIESTLSFFKPSEITLIHNGSLAKNVSLLKNNYPFLDHLYLPQNTGFSGGANRGLNYFFSKHLNNFALFLTNDTLIKSLPHKLNLAEGLFAPKVWRRETGKIDSLGAAIDLSTMKLKHLQKKNETLNSNEKFYVPGTAFLIDKSTWENCGPFDESLHTYWEDVDLSLRNQNFLGVCEEIELIHKVGKTCHKKKFYTSHLFPRNREIIKERYGLK